MCTSAYKNIIDYPYTIISMTWQGIFQMGKFQKIILYHKEIYFLWIIKIVPLHNTYSEKSISHFLHPIKIKYAIQLIFISYKNMDYVNNPCQKKDKGNTLKLIFKSL